MSVRNEREPRRPGPVIALAVILGGIWGVRGLASPAAAPTPEVKESGKDEATRSVWDGVYTEEQAVRGRSIFRAQCADCHKPDEFKKGFRTADEIFSSRSDMPQSSPDSLSAQAYADLIAYIFEANGLPSGKEELKGDPETLKQIRIDAERPGRP